MQKRKSKKIRKLIAIITLGITGAAIGSATIIPFILRNWKTIQYYEILDINQNNDKTTDTSLAFSFEFSDKQSFDLEKKQIKVNILENPNSENEKIVQTGFAKYVSGLRKWEFESDLVNKLKAGQKYKVDVVSEDEFKKFKILNENKQIMHTKANVLSFDFKTLSPSEKEVKVKFADDVKSLENRQAEIKYYYLTDDGNGNVVKNQETVSQRSLIKNGESVFVLENLLPSRNYLIETVSYINSAENNGVVNDSPVTIPWDSSISKDIFTGEEKLATPKTPIFVSSINYVAQSNKINTSIIFSKKNGEIIDDLLNNKERKVILKYKLKDNDEILIKESLIKNSVADFELTNLKSGSIYEIVGFEIEDAIVEFNEKLNKDQLLLNTPVAVSSIEIKDVDSISAKVKVEIINQENKDNIENSYISLEINNPNKPNVAVTRTKVVKKDNDANIYTASFDVKGLLQGKDYLINKITIWKADNLEKEQTLEFNDFTSQESSRSFTTPISKANLFLQGHIVANHNSATANFVYDPDNDFINGHKLVLKYRKIVPNSEEIYSVSATAESNYVNFKLGGDNIVIKDPNSQDEDQEQQSIQPLDSGTKYQLISLEFADKNQNLDSQFANVNLQIVTNSEEDKQFTTFLKIDQISYSDKSETSIKVKVKFLDLTNSLIYDNLNNQNSRTNRQAKIFYNSLNLNLSPASTELVTINENNEVEFTLTNLVKGGQYQITDIQLYPDISTFYKKDILGRNDTTFTTLAQNFEVANATVNNISYNSANVNLNFDLKTDIILINKQVKVYYQENLEPNPVVKSFTTTIDDTGEINYNLTDLNEASSYTITNIEVLDNNNENYNFTFNDQIKNNLSFFTKPVINSFAFKNIKQNSADVQVNLTTKNDQLFTDTNANVPVAIYYLSNNGVSQVYNTTVTTSQLNNKTFTVNLANLEKDNIYTIEKVSINNEFIKRANDFSEDNNSFKTAASSATIIGFNQISNSKNSVAFEMAFDPYVDSFMNNKTVTLEYQNADTLETHTVQATVDHNSNLRFKIDNLPPGSKFNITNISATNEQNQNIALDFAGSINNDSKYFFTAPLVNKIEFKNIGETSATMEIGFGDVQNQYNNKHFLITLINDKTKATTEINSKTLTPNKVIENNSISLQLSDLDKLTTYKLISIKVEKANDVYETVAILESLVKEFTTTATNVAITNKYIENVTNNSANLSYVFSDQDWYLENKNATITYQYQKNNQTVSATETVLITRNQGALVANFNLNNLEEGTNFNITNLAIDGVQTIENYQTTFNTFAVVDKMSINDIGETSATVNVEFKNQNPNNSFENKNAIIKFISEFNGTTKSASATVNNNRVTFNLDNLEKITKYVLHEVQVQDDSGQYQTINLSDSFGDGNQESKVNNFTTVANTAEVVLIDVSPTTRTTTSLDLAIGFNKIKDSYLANKSATITYKNLKTPDQLITTQVAQVIDSESNSAIFHLDNLPEGDGFEIHSINIDNVNVKIPQTINKKFATAPVVKSIIYGQTGDQVLYNYTVSLNDDSRSLENQEIKSYFISKETGKSFVFTHSARIANGSSFNNISSAPVFDKFNTYVLERVEVGGADVPLASTLTEEQRLFKTTASSATVKEIRVIDFTKDRVVVEVLFDPIVDWYLLNKRIKMNFSGDNKQFVSNDVTIDSQGAAQFILSNDTITNGSQLTYGKTYTINSIEVKSEDNVDTRTNITISPTTFSTASIINGISYSNKTENSLTATVTLDSQDSTLQSKKAFITYLNSETNEILQQESELNIDSSFNVSFNLTNLAKDVPYSVLGISIERPTAAFLDYASSISESDKSFRTVPSSATITSMTYKWADDSKTKMLVTFTFDSNVDSFMNNKALKLTYKRIESNYDTANTQSIVVSLKDSTDIIVRGSTVQFELQGLVDPATGDAINNDSNATHKQLHTSTFNNGVFQTNANFKGLILGSKYQIESVEMAKPDQQGNIAINWNPSITAEQKFFVTPASVIDYYVDPGRGDQDEDEDGFNALIYATYRTTEDLTAMDKNKIQIALFNLISNVYENFDATTVRKLDNNIETLYRVEFRVKLQKQARYEIHNTFIDDKAVFRSPVYYGGVNTVEAFDTKGNKVTVSNIEFIEQSKSSYKVLVSLVAANENILRTNRSASVTITKANSNESQTFNNLYVNPQSKKIEFTINNLKDASLYEITNFTFSGSSRSGNTPDSSSSSALYKNGVIKSFNTRAVIDRIQATNISETSMRIKVTLNGDISNLTNSNAIVSISKISDANSLLTFVSDGNFNVADNSIEFVVNNLEKEIEYKVLNLNVNSKLYEWKATVTPDENKFKTIGETSHVNGLTFVVNGPSKPQVNNSVLVTASFISDDVYMNNRELEIYYRLLDDQNRPTGAELKSSATVTGGSATFDLSSNIEDGKSYIIERIVNVNVSAPAKASVISIDPAVHKIFHSYSIVSDIRITTSEQFATITVQLQDNDLKRSVSKNVNITINGTSETYNAIVEGNRSFSFVALNLDKETTYSINTITIDNKELNFTTSAESKKQFTTLGNSATIDTISQLESTTTSAKIKLTFDNVDKYLQNKQVKLKYKEVGNNNAQEQISTTVATIMLDNQNKAYVEFTLNQPEVSSAKKYQVVNLVSEPDSSAINYAVSSILVNTNPDSQYFETRVTQPEIESVRILSTTNPEGLEDSYLSTVELTFNDPKYIVNTNLINDWEFEVLNHNKGTFTYINRRAERDDAQGKTKVFFDIKGDVKKLMKNDNELAVNKFTYFNDLDRTISVETAVVTVKGDPNVAATNTNKLIVTIAQDFLIDSVNGILSTGFDFEWTMRVYDPRRKLQDMGERYGGFDYNGDGVVDSGTRTIQKLGTDGFYFEVDAKRSILNLKGKGGGRSGKGLNNNNYLENWGWSYNFNAAAPQQGTPEWEKLDQLTKWEEGFTFADKDDQVSPTYGANTGADPKLLLPNVAKWKFTNDADWYNISNHLVRDVTFIKRDPSDQDYVEVKIHINSAKTNFLVSKIIKLDLDRLKIKNQNVLFARNTAKTWEVYQTQTITGGGKNFLGSATSPQFTSGKEQRFEIGPAPVIRAENGDVDNSAIGLWNSEITKDNKKYLVQVHLPKQSENDTNIIQRITSAPIQLFAMFINQKGDLFIFGGSDGKGVDILNHEVYGQYHPQPGGSQKFVPSYMQYTFDLTTNSIPDDQKPENNEKLRFVGVFGTPYSQDIGHLAEHIYFFNWYQLENAYQEITYIK
ncbi:hypothetical protein [Mesomycoplasma lagogenitalium]|uniref:DUF1410 domain-containing protein n=1 Tax=Mesomycoplasma lagogenitalium TaxID=171286 RepID=A0ABY8LUQ9_9BACT|nr:hypothetical protein [Mesomycoplasma lagogenitalium]WGI36977.1 hypothetical protein QEG99_01685 [Mesomycoplasma lagogenitalium]